MHMILFDCQIQGTRNHFLGLAPIAYEHKIYAKIVVSDYRVKNVIGLVKEFDRFFQACHAVIRPSKQPIGAGHIRIKLAKHEWSRVRSNDLYSLIKKLQ